MSPRSRRAGILASFTIVLCAAGIAPAGLPCANAAAHTGGSWAAQTVDRNADGRIDAVRVTLPARYRTGLRITVGGRRVKGVSWRHGHHGRVRALVRIAARHKADTARRPSVTLSRAGRSLRRIRACDRARPVLVDARFARAHGGAPAPLLVLRFSEPVRFRGTAKGDRVLRIDGTQVRSIGRARLGRLVRARLAQAVVLPKRARVRVVHARRAPRIRDRAGNVTTAAAVRVSSAGSTGTDASGTGVWHTLSNPIDPMQQLALPWGYRSHWLQPWRAYLDTVPAPRFRNAVGINFNVPAFVAQPVAALLAQSGFRRARVEIPWDAMSYADPTRLRDPASIRQRIEALRANGIRPLVLLNANHGAPGPVQLFDARITEPAAAGSRRVRVDAATRDRLVPGLSGFNGADGKAAAVIATSVSADGWVGLSRALADDIEPGTYPAALLRYPPFTAPFTASGAPQPSFERTLAGWLDYVRAAVGEVRAVLGSDDFDVEIWNEESFGSDFLRVGTYYDPIPPELTGQGSVEDAILRRTIAWLRDPAHGVSRVGIGNGFANQTPFAAGSTSPLGLTALDKHPYRGPVDFPNPAFNADQTWTNSFMPRYRAFFPEYFLSGIQTETLVRDLSPFTTQIGRVPHGRYTMPPGGSAPPEMWITETALAPEGSGVLDPAAKRHLQAKATLRDLVAFVNKGVSALYFYAVANGDYGMLDPAASGGGETLVAVRRLTAAMAGPQTISSPRSLTLAAIADRHDHIQFAGDGTPGNPALYNREVVAFLPFQADANRFVVPAYVMTRDMSKVYDPSASTSDPSRYDLPPETYRLTVGGLHADRLTASATDPLTGTSVPVTIVSRSGDTAVLELALTDSPRLILLNDG